MEALLVKDKWDDWVISNDKGVSFAALDLLRKRLDEGFWYDNWTTDKPGHPARLWEDEAKEIVECEDATRAFAFLMDRIEFEYEYVRVINA